MCSVLAWDYRFAMKVATALGHPSATLLAAADVAVATTFGAVAAIEVTRLQDHPPLGASVLLAVLCASTVAWRRMAPLPALATALGAMVAYQLVSGDPNMAVEPYCGALAAYMVGRLLPPRPLHPGLVTLG